ncbi:unnamed protein product [Aphanomyces euteiches]
MNNSEINDEWEECADEEGRIFFMNKATGETAWEIPSTAPLPIDEAPIVEEACEIKPLQRTPSFILDTSWQERLTAIRSRLGGDGNQIVTFPEPDWIHSFDPIARQDYFYESHQGFMTRQPQDIFRTSDPLINCILVIQCAIRSALARRRVALAKSQQPRPPVVKAITKEAEIQREAEERHDMLASERVQCDFGDRFWGIDQRAREVHRQLAEESLMREAEDLRRALHDAARKREEMQRRAADELDRKRRSEDSALESRERQAMQMQEMLQCKSDSFWGVQKQENDEKCSMDEMAQQDAESQQYTQDLMAAQLHARWAMEAARALKEENIRRSVQEVRYRKQYMRLFKRATTSQDIVLYRWPSQSTPQGLERPGSSSTTGFQYRLDAVLDPQRHSNPKHIFHTASSAHMVGRKGKLDLSQKESCYELEKPRIVHQPLTSPYPRNPNVAASVHGLPFKLNKPRKDQTTSAHVAKVTLKAHGKKFCLQPLGNYSTEQQTSSSESNQEMDPRIADEERILARVFNLIDLDHGGTLDKHEMLWALTKDAYVRHEAMQSLVLRTMLKKRSVDALFNDMVGDNQSVGWTDFWTFCRAHLVAILAERDANPRPEVDETSSDAVLRRKNEAYAARKAILDEEEAIAKVVFGLVDADHSGKVDQHEMMAALESNDRVRDCVARSKGLRPLLENPAFGKAFVSMATDDAAGMSLDEFLAFCTEIASVALLNDLVVA